MRNLLVRLIGENIELKFHLDPNLGLVKMDPTQSQQILLNLVLNARDAMPGRRHDHRFGNQQLQSAGPYRSRPARKQQGALLPCALFVVADNGSAWTAKTQALICLKPFSRLKLAREPGLGWPRFTTL